MEANVQTAPLVHTMLFENFFVDHIIIIIFYLNEDKKRHFFTLLNNLGRQFSKNYYTKHSLFPDEVYVIIIIFRLKISIIEHINL